MGAAATGVTKGAPKKRRKRKGKEEREKRKRKRKRKEGRKKRKDRKVNQYNERGANQGWIKSGRRRRPPPYFFRDKASHFVWAPQRKKCTKSCELTLKIKFFLHF